MKVTPLFSRRTTVSKAVLCAVILLSTAAMAVPFASNSPASAATIAKCTTANTYVWASSAGNGTAGTTYYVLEFSNIGSKACTLRGNATVRGVTKTGVPLGKPASAQGAPSTVTLAPMGTAHAILGVEDTGAACPGKSVNAAGLRVVPPGQTLPNPAGEKDEVENFGVSVCVSKSSMSVQPIRAGTGIPLYTTS
jgi:hypothetical protein